MIRALLVLLCQRLAHLLWWLGHRTEDQGRLCHRLAREAWLASYRLRHGPEMTRIVRARFLP